MRYIAMAEGFTYAKNKLQEAIQPLFKSFDRRIFEDKKEMQKAINHLERKIDELNNKHNRCRFEEIRKIKGVIGGKTELSIFLDHCNIHFHQENTTELFQEGGSDE